LVPTAAFSAGLVALPGGGLLVGGGFNTWNGISTNLVRLNPDGSRDPALANVICSVASARS